MSSRRLPTVKQLTYIVALDEERHFGRAAEKCFISQSAFSVAIRELEKLMGVQLVDRTNKSVVLTAEGSLFAERARVVIEEIEAMADAVASGGEPLSGRLKLGVIPTIAPFILPALLARLRHSYPHLQLFIREEQTNRIYQELLAGELDLLLNRRVLLGFFPWRFVDGESSIGRCVAMLDDKEYEELQKVKEKLPKTKFGDAFNPAHVEQIEELTKKNY